MALPTNHVDGDTIFAAHVNDIAAAVNGLALGGGPIGFQYATEAAGLIDLNVLRASSPAAVYGAKVTSTSGTVTIRLPDPATTEDLNVVVFADDPLDTMATFDWVDSNGDPGLVTGTPDLSQETAAFVAWPLDGVWGISQVLVTSSGGTGDVAGPASSTDSHVALFDGTTGKLLKDGGATGAAGLALLTKATAADVRTYLGLVLGTDVQAYHSNLANLSSLTFVADRLLTIDSGGHANLEKLTAFAITLLDDVDAAAARATLGLGSLATASTVTSTDITNGTIVDADISTSAAIQRTKLATPLSGLYVSGELYSVPVATGGTRTIPPGSVYFFPIQPEGPLSIAALAYQVVTGAASGTAHVYLVTADPTTGSPSTTSTILKSVALADTSTSTAKVVANFASSYAATPGLYWGALHAIVGTATFAAASSAAQFGPPLRRASGYSTNGLTGINATGGGTSTTPLSSLSGLTFQPDFNQAPMIEWKAA